MKIDAMVIDCDVAVAVSSRVTDECGGD